MNARSWSFAVFCLWAVAIWSVNPCPAALIKGTVTDSLTSAAMPAVVVKVKGTTDSTLTDTAGRFTLNTTVGIGRAVSITSAKIPSNVLVTVYRPDGTILLSGRVPELSALPDGIYLLAYQENGSTRAGKLVKFGTLCQAGPWQTAGKAAANVTLVCAKYYCRTMELVAAEGDTNVRVRLVLKKGWELDSTNTGLAGAGIDKNSLPLYNQYVDEWGSMWPPHGTVISRKKITASAIILYNGNITLDRCLIQPTSSAGVSSIIFTYDPGFSRDSQYSNSIIDCDIDATNVTDWRIYYDCAIRGGGFTAKRCHIYGMGSGIALFETGYGLNCEVTQNYVHGLRSSNGARDDHHESGTIRGFDGTSNIWKNNRLESRSGADSGALFIQAGGHINGATITGNLFWTGAYDIPLEAGSGGYGNMVVVDNRFVLVAGGYGIGYVSGGPGWTQWTGNYYNDPTKPENRGPAVSKP